MEDRLIENKAFRVILMGVEEIVGKNGLKSILNYADLTRYIDTMPPNNEEKTDCRISEITRLDEAIEEVFGNRGARAILFQVGRMQAKHGIEENPDVSQQALAAMAGMSNSDRARIILTYTADTISRQLDTKTWVEEEGEALFYKDKSATHCFDRTSEAPVCHTTMGFLFGLASWAAPDGKWKIEETGCMAMGEAYCTYRVTNELTG